MKRKRHGHASPRTPEYMAWQNMIQRCCNEKFRQYKNYGGRGITVTDEWRGYGGFKKFLDHVGTRPSPSHTLDRINNDLGYVPGNIRWVSGKVQNRNTTKNVWISWSGIRLTVSEWSEKTGIPHSTILSRIRSGWQESRLLI